MKSNTLAGIELLERRTFIIGREGHIYITDPTISKYHAEISINNGKVFLRDLNSTNGTFLLVDKKLVPFHEGFVDLDQPIVIGKKLKTPRALLATAATFVPDGQIK